MKFLVTYQTKTGAGRRILEKNSMEQAERAVIHEMQEAGIKIETLGVTRIIDSGAHYPWFETKMELASLSPEEFDEFMCEVYQLRMSDRKSVTKA